ncbi:hypothetical protein [Actinomadura rayongensis]|uniref:Uncharacterized protein n=1 Tax=Actinomadura rayongensis TaxID=1429076 RepID=A0A6I4W890_9ACTN|nr:hypothetical protein [Actinomadura rayongensis]MXQ65848.1 hypothetical protein [Actinomadura rayongensis]
MNEFWRGTSSNNFRRRVAEPRRFRQKFDDFWEIDVQLVDGPEYFTHAARLCGRVEVWVVNVMTQVMNRILAWAILFERATGIEPA